MFYCQYWQKMFVILGLVILTLLPCIRMEQVSDTIDLKQMYAEMTQLTERVNELEMKNDILVKKNEELKARIEVLDATTHYQQRKLDNFKEGIQRKMLVGNEMTVAFFSKLANHIKNPGAHQQIVFEQVVTNVGNGYNNFSGDFRAPVRGVYVFSTTIMADTRAYTYHFQYMLNGSAISNIYIDNGGTASQEVVLDLQQGDTVAIHSLDPGHAIYGHGYSSFSGFLLQQIYETTAVDCK
ncbi:Complement C1q-like protein 4 [Mactra antiquata]